MNTKKSGRISVITTVLLVCCAVALTGFNVWRSHVRAHLEPTRPWQIVPDWRSYSTTGHWFGPRDARVVVIEFTDYECPTCRLMNQHIEALRKRYPRSLGVVIRHYPMRAQSYTAALAAECAAVQGDFEAFHNHLLASEIQSTDDASWLRYGAASGIADSIAFKRCVDARASASAVDADLQAGKKLGIVSTPTVLVGPDEYSGVPWDFDDIVARRIKELGAN